MILRVKNWTKFQHYKDRSPPWIKLQRTLLDDRAFHQLPDASRALAPMLWLLASESSDGSINDPMAEIVFRLRMTEAKVDAALKPLIEAGFFILEQDASAPIAPCEQVASQRERQKAEGEEEGAFTIFVETARKHGWPTPRAMDAGRRKKLRLRLQEHGLDGWTAMLKRAEQSEWLRTKFALKLDWVLEPSNFTKVIEGNYDDKGGAPKAPPGTPPPTPAIDWAARLRGYKPGQKFWPGDWGPRPESGKCWAPASLLSEVRG